MGGQPLTMTPPQMLPAGGRIVGMTDEARDGDEVEVWEVVDDSRYARLLADAHPFDPTVDPPVAFVDPEKPHNTYNAISVIKRARPDGTTLYSVLMRLQTQS
jgi:hypothetical protein